MLIRLVGVSMAELESALRFSGLYVQTDEVNREYAEIKAIPEFVLHDDVRTLDRVKTMLERGE
jgi:hypothetical protein